MEGNRRFGQDPGFRGGQGFERPRPKQPFAGDLRIGPNGRVIQPGQERRSSGPVPGTSARKHRNSGQRGR